MEPQSSSKDLATVNSLIPQGKNPSLEEEIEAFKINYLCIKQRGEENQIPTHQLRNFSEFVQKIAENPGLLKHDMDFREYFYHAGIPEIVHTVCMTKSDDLEVNFSSVQTFFHFRNSD